MVPVRARGCFIVREFGTGGELVRYQYGTGGEPVRNWVDVFRLFGSLPLSKIFDDAVLFPVHGVPDPIIQDEFSQQRQCRSCQPGGIQL